MKTDIVVKDREGHVKTFTQDGKVLDKLVEGAIVLELTPSKGVGHVKRAGSQESSSDGDDCLYESLKAIFSLVGSTPSGALIKGVGYALSEAFDIPYVGEGSDYVPPPLPSWYKRGWEASPPAWDSKNLFKIF